MTRAGWLDCSSGVSGDMLLGALESLGALTAMPELIGSLHDLDIGCAAMPTTRGGLAATSYRVTAGADQPVRGLTDVLAVIDRAAVPEAVKERAARIFRRIADVEAGLHATTPEQVHFHEVGAVDSIVDVLGGCLGLHALALDALVVSPIAVGGGTTSSAHGTLPVPAPATLGLLAGSALSAVGGPTDTEHATPTGVAILAEWATGSGSMPAMTVDAIGVGAGSRDLPDRANVVRLVVGSVDTAADVGWCTVEANVDDLDPRLWPIVLDKLLAAGAADAWLTPILMKKGRPAHTVSALVGPDAAAEVRQVLVTETSTIGVRCLPVAKYALDRSWITVDIDGEKVRVKLAHAGGTRTNLAPEFDDVAAAAEQLGRPAKEILARATAAALQSLEG